MATTTTNYSLKKPLGTENYNVEDQNGNMDILDTKIKEIDTKVVTYLAEIVTVAEPNKIPRALASGKLDLGWLPTPTWEKIAEQTLTSAVAQVDFAGIPSGYKNFKIMFDALNGTATDATIALRFNGDTGNNYKCETLFGTSTTVNANALLSQSSLVVERFLLPGTGNPFSFGNIDISNFNPSKAKRVISDSFSDMGGLTRCIVGGSWANITNEINKISILATTGTISIGSRFVLWGCK